MKKYIDIFLITLFFIFIHMLLPCGQDLAAEWQSQTMLKPKEGAMPLLPFLKYYIDESRSMDIDEISKESMEPEFKTLVLDDLPRVEGITWLRFSIAPLPPEAKPGTFLLDMGESFPGIPVLFNPERNQLSGALEWQEKTPSSRNIILLPEEGSQAITCYIRIDGLPGPWFAPLIRTPQDAASNLASLSRNAAILTLAIVFVICILRGLGEQGQWRIWTGLFTAVALAQAILGMPAVSDKFNPVSLAAILAPGIALMILPHAGRHLMQTPSNSRNLDIQLFLLSFPGAVLALWPLVPGWSWLDRWVDIWPLFTILFVPTALASWIMGLGGAKRFLTACLIPPILTGFALTGLDFGFPANVLASLPLWGIACCALLIAATRSPSPTPGNSDKRQTRQSNPGVPSQEEIITLEHPLDDPNLRLLPTQEIEPPIPAAIAEAKPVEYPKGTPERINALEERENVLRAPLDDILRLGAALGQCALPPAVRQYAENMITAANMLADILSGEKVPARDIGQKSDKPEQYVAFGIQEVLRNVHDSVASFAESAGTALSWYSPPNLGRLYYGNRSELEDTLFLLMESAIRATKNGSVHLSARRMPGSEDPGHILFSITDNGSGVPPKDRSSLAISRAWELIGRQGGYLAMEASPEGVDIALSLRFPVEEEEENVPGEGTHVLLASDDVQRRKELAQAIEELPCRVSQLGTSEEIIICQGKDPAGLLITHGMLAKPSAADTIHKFANLAKEAGFAKFFILAITPDNTQWHLLKLSGFTHAMQEPEDLETLKATISALLSAIQEITPASEPQENIETVPLLIEEEQIEDTNAEPVSQEPIKLPPAPPAAQVTDPSPSPDFSEKENKPSLNFEGPDWLNPQASEEVEEDVKTEQKVQEEKTASDSEAEEEKPINTMMTHVMGQEDRQEITSSPDQAEKEEGDPVILALIRELDLAMREASRAYENQNSEQVAEATGRIIRECDKFGLRLLARMASCVERAAKENDLSALSDLLPELGLAVERNRVALNENIRNSGQG